MGDGVQPTAGNLIYDLCCAGPEVRQVALEMMGSFIALIVVVLCICMGLYAVKQSCLSCIHQGEKYDSTSLRDDRRGLLDDTTIDP